MRRLPDCAAYELESAGPRVALLYLKSLSRPRVWCQDNSCNWFFMASSFTDYQLMIMHLGMPNWQYAYTTVGLGPTSQQWFRFMSPERLAIDVDGGKRREPMLRAKVAPSAKEMVLSKMVARPRTRGIH